MNRQEFSGGASNDLKIISSPNLIKFSILQTKDFEYRVFIPGGPWGDSTNRKEMVTKYRIKIFSGSMSYPNKKTPFTSTTEEDIWVGKKWLERKMRERDNRLKKRQKYVKQV